MREVLLVALVLACPLMMILMMRGGHGHADCDRAEQRTADETDSLRGAK